MADEPTVNDSFLAGREHALQLLGAAPALMAAPAGYLIAEGDSWFDYPLFEDIAGALEKPPHNYRIKSAAHHGDTVESMAYEDRQLERLRKVFQELSDENDEAGSKTPKAIILSCGGNDIAHAFEALLNHRRSGLPTINDDIVRGLLDVRVKTAISSLIGALAAFSERYFGTRIRVLLHGYGYVVPDGRGYPVLGLAGPWLKPGFMGKGYVSLDPQPAYELQANAEVMQALIDHFNDSVLAGIVETPELSGFVRRVDLRGVFSNVVSGNTYQNDWRDEMHATSAAFRRAADLYAAAI